MNFIALFVPALFTVTIRQKRKNAGEPKIFPTVLEYGKAVLICNLFAMLVVTYIFKIDGIMETAFASFPFFIKYVIIELLFACALPYLEEIWEKYVHISFTVEGKDEE